MLLLNAVRALLTLIGLIIFDACRIAYGLQGIGMWSVLALILFVVFVSGDAAEAGLIAYFNPEDKKR